MALAIPKKKEEDVKPVEEEVQEDPVNLDDPQSRMDFLKGQLDDLLESINSTYGQELMEELLHRLEKTVEDFNEQVSSLIGRLKSGKILEPDVEPPPQVLGGDDAGTDEGDEDEERDDTEDEDIVKRMMRRAAQSEDSEE